ncbi:hypothetical protein D3C81_559700 [compost metagenome]
MVPFVALGKLDRSKIQPKPREWHLAQIQKFQAAQAELERVCKEQGIPVPQMVC